jgi:hypothetical protein
MPENSKVHHVFEALKEEGKSESSAARIAQSVTHEALATGKPPAHDEHKQHQLHHSAPPPEHSVPIDTGASAMPTEGHYMDHTQTESVPVHAAPTGTEGLHQHAQHGEHKMEVHGHTTEHQNSGVKHHEQHSGHHKDHPWTHR